MRGEVGKKIPIKEMDNRCIFMTSHMTLSSAEKDDVFLIYIYIQTIDRNLYCLILSNVTLIK